VLRRLAFLGCRRCDGARGAESFRTGQSHLSEDSTSCREAAFGHLGVDPMSACNTQLCSGQWVKAAASMLQRMKQ
jgi:hypothetical protein